MGACASCLGLTSRDNEDERSRLLNSDEQTYGSHYNGGYFPGQMNEQYEHQREREQLEQIVAQTSDNLIDIFHMHTSPGPYADANRIEAYKVLIQRTSPPPQIVMPEVLPQTCISDEEREMMERIGKMADEAVLGLKTVKRVESLLVSMDVEN